MNRLPLLLLAALAAASCRSTPVNSVEPAPDDYEKVVVSGVLDQSAKLGAVRSAREDGLLQVQVDVTNTTRSRFTLQYLFEWFDGNGMQVAGTSAVWKQLTLQPGETTALRGLASDRAAADFRLKVKSK